MWKLLNGWDGLDGKYGLLDLDGITFWSECLKLPHMADIFANEWNGHYGWYD